MSPTKLSPNPTAGATWPPIAWLRWTVWSGLFVALIVAIAGTVVQINLDRSCKNGAFSNAFSGGFEIHRCRISIEHVPTRAKITVPPPASWF